MAKRKNLIITNKTLGIALMVGLIFQYILPKAGIGMLQGVAILIYLIVALYLILF